MQTPVHRSDGPLRPRSVRHACDAHDALLHLAVDDAIVLEVCLAGAGQTARRLIHLFRDGRAPGTDRPALSYGAVPQGGHQGGQQQQGGTRTSCSTLIHLLVGAGWPASSPAPRWPGCSFRRRPMPGPGRTPASGATTTSTRSCSSASPWRGSGSTRRRCRRSPTPTAAPGPTRRPGYTASVDYVVETMLAAGWDVERVPFTYRGGRRRSRAAHPGQATYETRRVHGDRRRRRDRPPWSPSTST